MTVEDLINLYPEVTGEIYNSGFTSGQQAERKAWQDRVLSEEETGKVLDEIIDRALAP